MCNFLCLELMFAPDIEPDMHAIMLEVLLRPITDIQGASR